MYFAFAALLALLAGAASPAAEPQRIITMMPSLTETVCALGACGKIVATDRYSNWPASVEALPKTGGLDDASVEMILSLKPDLVLLSNTQRLGGRLRELGLHPVELPTEDYADIARNVTAIGELLGLQDRAVALNAEIERNVKDISAQAQAWAHHRGSAPTVYFEIDRTPYAAGPRSYIGELLTRLGARNIVTADLGAFPQLNPEYVVRHDPDVIFADSADVAALASRPGWDRIGAVREHHLCSFSKSVNDTIMRAGPRVAEGMQAIAGCLARMAP